MALLDSYKTAVVSALRPNRYKCRIYFPAQIGNTQDLAEECEIVVRSSQLPGRSIGSIDLPKQGNPFSIPGDFAQPEDITITFLNLANVKMRKAIERWLEFIASPVAGTRANNVTVFGTIQIEQLDGVFAVVDTYELLWAYPISIGSIAVSDDEQDSVSQFDATFKYSVPVTNLL